MKPSITLTTLIGIVALWDAFAAGLEYGKDWVNFGLLVAFSIVYMAWFAGCVFFSTVDLAVKTYRR